MSQPRRTGRSGLFAIPFLGAVALLFALMAPRAAQAHALDIYLQATYITVAPAEIVVELDLTPGVLVAPEVLSQLDADGDKQITEAEGLAYANTVLSNVVLQVDGQPLALTVTNVDMPGYLTIQAGYGTIRVFTTAPMASGISGTHQIAYANNTPVGAAYQVNAFVNREAAVDLGTQNRDSIQQTMTVDFAVGEGATVAAEDQSAEEVVQADASGRERRLLWYLETPSLSAWQLLLAFGIAAGLGGLHVLTPGHGKTLVAAYLVGSRGTVRHAALLGGIVTFTHTVSVIVIGLIALFASHFIVPSLLVPILQIVSGALVVAIGAKLVWQRWTAFRRRRHPNQTPPLVLDHIHGDANATGLVHDHGDGKLHAHLPPTGGLRPGGLVAMGIFGGLVPCPEALGIMIVAVGLNRILLGLGLIVSFSFGLAAVLIAIGILLVRSRSLVDRVGGLSGRLSTGLPLGSAFIVTILGIGFTLSGVTS